MSTSIQRFRCFADGKTEIAGYLCDCGGGILFFVRKIVHNLENIVDAYHRLPIPHGQPKVIPKDET
ncbi:hypothetical protein [Pseudophaeobacter leonis]|uniref:hypothetical protein n=1 Tax=Pseudophaeobacter leonis TaxID=1144477 RepID=UPI0009F5C482|nr:hypothetical protein [Pseudophaeobacter leonis]